MRYEISINGLWTNRLTNYRHMDQVDYYGLCRGKSTNHHNQSTQPPTESCKIEIGLEIENAKVESIVKINLSL